MKLGPRIIPFFKDIVSKSISLLSSTDNGENTSLVALLILSIFEAVLEKTSAVLHGLLTSIPAFWGPDALTQMVNVYMDHYKVTSGSPKAPVSSLMRVISKNVPAKLLLPSLLDNWVATSTSKNLVSHKF